MGCCGSQRQKQYVKQRVAQTRPVPDPPHGGYKEVFFEYVGKTGMTVIGPISGLKYRFVGHGAILPVDPRDRASLLNVPNLRQVKPEL